MERAAPNEEAIRVRALEIFLTRTGSGICGDSMSDWLQAEREILAAGQDSIDPHPPGSASSA
jgi:hypothetical protein